MKTYLVLQTYVPEGINDKVIYSGVDREVAEAFEQKSKHYDLTLQVWGNSLHLQTYTKRRGVQEIWSLSFDRLSEVEGEVAKKQKELQDSEDLLANIKQGLGDTPEKGETL